MSTSTAIAPTAARSTIEVEPRRTVATPPELRAAIGRAYERVTGKPPTSALLDTLSAQAALETGRGASMYNFNFGGIKGAGPHGETANCMTHEVTDSRQITLRQGFRSYRSLDEGAEDYVRVLSGTFGAAMSKAQVGDVAGFAHALKQGGYYTASEADYATALRSLGGQGSTSPLLPLSAVPQATFSSSEDLSRVMDALSISAMRIVAPSDDEG
jgi:hypothetical protein